MHYIKSPKGTVHKIAKGGSRTACGRRVRMSWERRTEPPEKHELEYMCKNCDREGKKRFHHPVNLQSSDATLRQKIERMKAQVSEDPRKIG